MRYALLPLVALALLLAAPTEAQPAPSVPAAIPATQPYLRYVATPVGREHLDTAVVAFHRGPVTVELIAAVHVADRAYYQTLQKRLNRYQKLLFELVAEDGQTVVRSGVQSDSGLSGVQLWMRDKLQLSFQLEEIDYRRPNFVHADLGPDALMAHLRSHWLDTLGMLLRWMIRDMSRTVNADGTMHLGGLELLAGDVSDSTLLLKRMLAHELAELGDLTGAGTGSDALIGRRNEAALAVLDAEVAKGVKRLGIFYGGAHMPDMERRLLARGFVRGPVSGRGGRTGGVDWLVAWDLRARPQRR